jgi:hypothetical protein
MTKNDFVWICNQHSILPSIALEDDMVRKILKQDQGKSSVTNELLLSTYLKENL